MSKKRILTILLSVIYFFVIIYLDFALLSPLILPEDYCYYHFHEIPWWVELFYMNGGCNDHPEGSFFHVLLVAAISIVLAYFTARVFDRKIKKD